MSPHGDVDLLVQARSVLLDALTALEDYRDAVVVIGAQAICLRTGSANVGLAEATKDCDLGLDTRELPTHPRFEDSMTSAGFRQEGQPGNWRDRRGIPVDLMVPEALAGDAREGRRGIRLEPFSRESARRAVGLEAAVVDRSLMPISALAPCDGRVVTASVAGPAALLVAKLHKLGERQNGRPDRLLDKDAHDAYRLLVAIPTAELASSMRQLREDSLAGAALPTRLVRCRAGRQGFRDGRPGRGRCRTQSQSRPQHRSWHATSYRLQATDCPDWPAQPNCQPHKPRLTKPDGRRRITRSEAENPTIQ